VTAYNKIFKYQIWHLLALSVLVYTIKFYIEKNPDILTGSYWGANTHAWLWLAITIPVVHQIYVLVIWRLELYQRTFSSRFGVQRAFKVYAAGFSVLFASRLIFIIFLAISNRNSLKIEPAIAYSIAALITPLIIYLFYSVKNYFTIERAYGIDHFDKNYSEPYVKQGIFKYTDNGMYVFGLMILYLPGLLLFSEAAILVALFNHVYIWVHYYVTERPDMLEIYGKVPG